VVEGDAEVDELGGAELYSTPFADTVITAHTQELAAGGRNGAVTAAGRCLSAAFCQWGLCSCSLWPMGVQMAAPIRLPASALVASAPSHLNPTAPVLLEYV
jgi:hypothetical protein